MLFYFVKFWFSLILVKLRLARTKRKNKAYSVGLPLYSSGYACASALVFLITLSWCALGLAWAIACLAQTITPVLAATTFSIDVSSGFEGLAFLVSAAIFVVIVPFSCNV
jgi:hypothetical protein